MKTKYNILFLMNGAKPPRGGEFLVLNLITRLRRDIFQPILVYAAEGQVVQEIRKAGIQAVPIPLGEKLTHVYPRETRLYNPFFLLPFLWRLIKGNPIRKVAEFARIHEIDLIYGADNLSKLIGGIAGKMTGIKVVAHCHDDFQEDSLGKIMRFFYLLLLDKIVTVSEKVRRFFIKKRGPSSKVITIYNGIDPASFDREIVPDDIRKELGLPSDAIVIGSIGALEKDKGQKYLFDALSQLKSEGAKNLICLVCGTGPEEPNLRTLARAKDLSREILFLGHRADIQKILRAADLMVITSLTIESFSMVAIESMSMGIPVIATRVGGIPEVVSDGETGILLPPGDSDSLAKAIRTLLEQPMLRKTMGETGRKRVIEKFSIQNTVRKIEDLFLETLVEA